MLLMATSDCISSGTLSKDLRKLNINFPYFYGSSTYAKGKGEDSVLKSPVIGVDFHLHECLARD